MDVGQIEMYVERGHRVLTVICGGLLLSLLVYAGVAWLLLEQLGWEPPGAPMPGLLVPLLAAVAVGLTLAAAPLGRWAGEAAARHRGAEDPGGPVGAYVQQTLVAFALRESTGVVGLIASLLSGELVWCWALTALAMVAMLQAWPPKDGMQEWVRQRLPAGRAP